MNPRSLIRLSVLPLLPHVAWADHGVGPSRTDGVSPWLVLSGVLALLGAVAWALFGAGAGVREPDATTSEGSRPPEPDGPSD